MVTLNEATARLCATLGRSIHRSNVSRFCDKHGLKTRAGREVHVDFDRLLDLWTADYQRAVMSGEASGLRDAGTHPSPSGARASGPGDSLTPISRTRPLVEPEPNGATPNPANPAVREKTAKAARAEFELVRAIGAVVAVEDIEAMIGDAVGALREAIVTETPRAADRLAASLGVPDHRAREVSEHLRRFADALLDRFARGAAQAEAEILGEGEAAVRSRLDRLASIAAEARGVTTDLDLGPAHGTA